MTARVPEVAVAEAAWARLPSTRRTMVRAAWAPDCMATSARAGQIVECHQVADDEDLGVSRQ